MQRPSRDVRRVLALGDNSLCRQCCALICLVAVIVVTPLALLDAITIPWPGVRCIGIISVAKIYDPTDVVSVAVSDSSPDVQPFLGDQCKRWTLSGYPRHDW